ncbi:MAG: ATP-dependent Clp protease ATP-binding subunit [Patescibacteria group bacterium]
MAEEEIKINILECPECKGAGWKDKPNHKCRDCDGLGYAEEVRGVKLYWGRKMHGLLPSIRASFDRVVSFVQTGIIILAAFFFLVGILNLFDSLRAHNSIKPDLNLLFDILFAGYATAPLWLGIMLCIILYFHCFVYLKPEEISSKNPRYLFILAKDAPRGRKKPKIIDISASASVSTIKTITRALDWAREERQVPGPMHFLFSLFNEKEIQRVFLKLEIPIKEFIRDIGGSFGKIEQSKNAVLDGNMKKMLFRSFWEAVASEDEEIRPEHLLFSLISLPQLKVVLNKYGVSADDFSNIILWTKYRNKDSKNYLLKDSSSKPPHQYMNRGWSAIETKVLDQFGLDITDYARAGMLLPLVDREKETRMLVRILTRSTKNNAMLIGEEGSGRESLVKGLAKRIVKNQTNSFLFDKRVVKLDPGNLGVGAGSDVGLLKQRIESIMAEIVRSQNIIIYIPNIHELAKIQGAGGLDVISFLVPLFSKSVIQVIGGTTPQDYHDYIESRSEFAQTFDDIKINELSKQDSLKVLSMQIPLLERENGVLISYRAAEESINQSDRLVTGRLLPQKALDVVAEAIIRAKNVKGKEIVTQDEIREVFSEKTGIPITKIGGQEAEELLNLEQKIKAQVVGQEEAVKEVAAAIRRSRVKIGEDERPISVFMFVGPTGVGKTELAKTLAQIYFGSRNKMVRIDMSELATVYDLERLLGNSSGTVSGLLSEPVKKNPYILVLLDEFEKANPVIWDVFLQIFDDGRATDGRGNVINFTNTILIATSNVGSKMILENLGQGRTNQELKPLIKKELLSFFRPEFLNRFDDIIIFNALGTEEIRQIARIEINLLNKRIEEQQGVTVELTNEALDFLTKTGYSPEFGARFLKRTIREKIEDALVIGILKGTYPRGTVVKITREMMERGNKE